MIDLDKGERLVARAFAAASPATDRAQDELVVWAADNVPALITELRAARGVVKAAHKLESTSDCHCGLCVAVAAYDRTTGS